MENSVFSSHLGTQLQQSAYQEDQILRELYDSAPTQSKTSKIAVTLAKLKKIYAELRVIQEEKQLTEDKMLLGFERGLRMIGYVDGKEFLEKGRELFELCQILAFQFDQREGYQPKELKAEEKQKKEKREEKTEAEKKEVCKQAKEQLKTNCKPKQKKQQPQKVQEKVQQKVEQPSPKTIKKQPYKPKEKQQTAPKSKEQPQKQKIEQKPERPFEKKTQQKQQPQYRDELDQSLISVIQDILINESQPVIQSQPEDVTFPIVWQEKYGIQIKHREAKKESPTEHYQKICAKQSFKMGGTYRIKFRVKKYGTMAIGLVSSQYKSNKYIDDRKSPTALKYIAFQNGGGKITLCGVQRGNGHHIGLQNDKTLEMIFDSTKMTVKFINEKLGCYEIALPDAFKQYPLYLFLEMKQKDTCIQFL